jgi:hypothetical protein
VTFDEKRLNMNLIITLGAIAIGVGAPLIIWAIWIVPFVRTKSVPTLHGGRILADYIQAERLCRRLQFTPWFVKAFRMAIVLAMAMLIVATRIR